MMYSKDRLSDAYFDMLSELPPEAFNGYPENPCDWCTKSQDDVCDECPDNPFKDEVEVKKEAV